MGLLMLIFTGDYWHLALLTLCGVGLLALPWLPVAGLVYLWMRLRGKVRS
jgi:hypothetical protein